MRKIVILLIVSLSLIGCKKAETYKVAQKLKDCNVQYLDFNDGIFLESKATLNFPTNAARAACTYEYSESAMTRSVGGFKAVTSGKTSSNLFSRDVYDSICYIDNDVYVYQKYKQNGTTQNSSLNPVIFSLGADGRLIGISKANPSGRMRELFTYSSHNIVETNMSGDTLGEFYFENKNLVKVESYVYGPEGKIFSKEEILFSGYDNNINPFEHKYFVKGAFYRAFSQNNYDTYKRRVYNSSSDGTLYLADSAKYYTPIKHNSDGYPEFGNYE